jgi:predicted nucleic acid-binding protein
MRARPPPPTIYLDTSVLLGAVVRGAPHTQACGAFCAQLISARSRVYFSQLVRLELPQALRRLATTRPNLPPAVQAHYQLSRWGTDPAIRQAWLAFGLTRFEALLNRFSQVFELPWDTQVWQASVQIMGQYGLQMMDATHVATAQVHRLRDFASVDDDFRRIPSLDLWLIRDSRSTHFGLRRRAAARGTGLGLHRRGPRLAQGDGPCAW